jgi:lysozyme family protein
MNILDRIISTTIGHEGGYANHPDDRGGETMWGVTIAVARKHGYTGPMRSMPRSAAEDIYRKEYLVAPGFADIAAKYPAIAAELFDTGVNMGTAWPALFLQQALNALNNQATLYPDIAEDGACGPATRAALDAYMRARGAEAESVMLKALNCLQGARYIDLSRGRARNESFTFGWLRTRVSLP